MNQHENADLDVWVLAGQSNMQGCGALVGAAESDARVHCFSSAGSWEIASEPLHRLWESITPVHAQILRPNLDAKFADYSDAELAALEARERTHGAGLGIAFGTALADATGRDIGLIPAAHGATSLDNWSIESKTQGGASLYGAMLQRIEMAGGNLRGVLWYQGESDALAECSATYQARLTAWIADLRSHVGQADLPVLLVQLGRLVTPLVPEPISHWDGIRAALVNLSRDVPYTATTSAIDLGLDDTIHISTRGLIRLGRRMAHLATQMQTQPDDILGPHIESIEIAAEGAHILNLRCRGVSRGWLPADHISGFSVHDETGAPHPTLRIANVSRDINDATMLRILLSETPPVGVLLGYGIGHNPYCNATDEADMPLCAFLPRAINPLA